MKGYGLIGKTLTHSFSKTYFQKKFEKESLTGYYYNNFPLETIGQLPELIEKQKDLIGLNVTIPYKEQVVPYLDELDDVSQSIGAVNTVKISRSENKYRLRGYNTDAFGFHASILPAIKPFHKKALILGTGGASKAVSYVMKSLNIEVTFVSRHPVKPDQVSYQDLKPDVFSAYQIIINTSPLGMFPNIKDCPDIPYEQLTPECVLYDLIYNPEETVFLKKGKMKGAVVINGLEMLHLQAERAWGIWNNPGL